ncbi:MAG: hypothetical protein GY822_25635 [Deltaproteobacteria bacterium]|nr:hypothetical protein [Deltaproteobacteria bacterium]
MAILSGDFLLSFALPLLLSLQAVTPAQALADAKLPASVSKEEAMELSKSGEVLFLPRRTSSPFAALVLTRTSKKCSSVHQVMLDVEHYPKHWDHIDEDVTIKYRTKTRTRYTLHLDLPLAPSLEGLIENLGPQQVRFHDIETGGFSTFNLRNHSKGCLLNYQLYQPPGKESGFVGLLRKIEDGVGDSAELAAALATIRGYAPRRSTFEPPSQKALDVMGRLANTGVVLLVQHKKSGKVKIIGRRRIAQPTDVVLSRIQDRKRYATNADFLNDVDEKGAKTDWHVAYFNGRVNFQTLAQKHGQLLSQKGLRIREKVSGGDLDKGTWEWTVRKVPGGTDVQLVMDVDLTEGSFVLRTLSSHDATIREAARMQMVLTLLVDHLGGDVLKDQQRIARVK